MEVFHESTFEQICRLDYGSRHRFIGRTFRFEGIKPRHFFYKYRAIPVDGSRYAEECIAQLREILVDSKFWLSSPTAFNDPYDLRCYLNSQGSLQQKLTYFRELVKERSQGNWKQRQAEVQTFMQMSATKWEAYLRERVNARLDRFGVCSFSTSAKSIIMWGHYAAKHTGICLQFDVARDPQTFLSIVPVNYCQDLIECKWFDREKSSIALGDAIIRKSEEWSYEKEWRMVQAERANSHHPFDGAALSGIIFGVGFSKSAMSIVDELLAHRKARGLPDVRLYQAKLSPKKYAVSVYRAPLMAAS